MRPREQPGTAVGHWCELPGDSSGAQPGYQRWQNRGRGRTEDLTAGQVG
jgi:hypothetical protein